MYQLVSCRLTANIDSETKETAEKDSETIWPGPGAVCLPDDVRQQRYTESIPVKYSFPRMLGN